MNNKLRNVVVASSLAIVITGSTLIVNANPLVDTSRELVSNIKQVMEVAYRPTEKAIEGVKWLYSDTTKENVVEVPKLTEIPQSQTNEYLAELKLIRAELNEISNKETLTQEDRSYIKAMTYKIDGIMNKTFDTMSRSMKAVTSAINDLVVR